MTIPLLDLTREYAEIQQEAEIAVCGVLASGRYIMGGNVKMFENEFASYVGTQFAVSVANGTDALVLALRALDIGAGDEVITSPYTFFATAESIAAVGAIPVFCDVCKDTYNIDPEQILPLITKKTKAIMPVHLFGQCADMDKINAIAKRSGLFVIEDACQAAGAWYKGRMAGSLGDIACFSFFPTKNLGCAGDGGMITTDYESLAIICKGLHTHGGGADGARAAAQLCRQRKDKDAYRKEDCAAVEDAALAGDSKYYNYLVGQNSRLDELQAALLRVKLRRLDGNIEKRRAVAAFYNNALSNCGAVLPTGSSTAAHAYHLYVLLCENRAALVAGLAQRGISTGVYYPVPLHLQRAFEYLGYHVGSLPNAEYLSERAVAIPLYPQLSEQEQQFVAESVKELCR